MRIRLFADFVGGTTGTKKPVDEGGLLKKSIPGVFTAAGGAPVRQPDDYPGRGIHRVSLLKTKGERILPVGGWRKEK